MSEDNVNKDPFIVIVHLHARAGKVQAAIDALTKITEPTRTNPDCLEFRIFRDTTGSQSFTLLERWGSLEANMAHGQRDYMADYIATKDDIFESIDGDFVEEIHRQDV